MPIRRLIWASSWLRDISSCMRARIEDWMDVLQDLQKWAHGDTKKLKRIDRMDLWDGLAGWSGQSLLGRNDRKQVLRKVEGKSARMPLS